MNQRQWEIFFDLLNRIVNDPSKPTWQEKKRSVLDAASNDTDSGNLGEFTGWFAE